MHNTQILRKNPRGLLIAPPEFCTNLAFQPKFGADWAGFTLKLGQRVNQYKGNLWSVDSAQTG